MKFTSLRLSNKKFYWFQKALWTNVNFPEAKENLLMIPKKINSFKLSAINEAQVSNFIAFSSIFFNGFQTLPIYFLLRGYRRTSENKRISTIFQDFKALSVCSLLLEHFSIVSKARKLIGWKMFCRQFFSMLGCVRM